jgi:hypothetical protein
MDPVTTAISTAAPQVTSNMILYLQKFILGSSYPMVMPYCALANSLPNKAYGMKLYRLTAPIYLGTWNVLSFIIARKFGLSNRMRFVVGMICTYVCIVAFGIVHDIYTYKSDEWYAYMKKLIPHYIIMWNVVLYNIERIFS